MISLAAAAAAVGLDRTAFGQTMLAHPLVAATLGGWLAGGPADGFWLGTILTLLSLPHVPVGELRLRDWSSVALAGGYALGGRSAAEAGAVLVLVILSAAPAGYAILGVRAIALRLRARVDPRLSTGQLDGVSSAQALGLVSHALRGIVVTLLAASLYGWAAPRLVGLDPSLLDGLAKLWALAALLGLPLLCRLHLLPRLLERQRRV